MTSPLSPRIIYVEGKSDQKILERWFLDLKFEDAKGKNKVQSKAKEYHENWGLLDRDFADDKDVEASRQNNSRVIILRRYSIENYLLEPSIIAAVAQEFAQQYSDLKKWTDKNFVQSKLLQWANDLSTYATANYLISQWKVVVESDFRRYIRGPLPPHTILTYEEVVLDLKKRLDRLPPSQDLDELFKQTYGDIVNDVTQLDGVHRWIDGKVLLQSMLYHEAFGPHNFGQDRLFEELIDAGKKHKPNELQQLAEKWKA